MSLRNISVLFRHGAFRALAILVALSPISASAQTDGGALPRRLTLAEAESLLLQRNLAVLASRYQIEASRAARLIASYKPNLVLTIGAEQIPFSSPVPGSFPRLWHTNPDAGANPVLTLRVDKIVERGGKRELRTAQADYQVQAAEAQMLDAVRTQLFQLRQAFTNATLARENLLLAEATQQQYEQTERLTEVKVENGDLAGVEVYRVRAGRLQFQQVVLQARTTYEQATRDVLNLLGARAEEVSPPPKSVALANGEATGARVENVSQVSGGQQLSESLRFAPLEILGTFDDHPVVQTLAALREIALAERPDVLAARHNLEAAGKGMLLAKAQRSRDLDVAFEYQRVGSDHSSGVVLQFPLFVYNNQRAAITQAEALRQAAEALLRQAELQAVTDVEKAYQAYQSARRMLDLYNSQNLTQVEKLRSIAAYSFKEGAVSLFELLDAQRTYNQAITAYNQARADYQLSLWQLEQATGRPLR